MGTKKGLERIFNNLMAFSLISKGFTEAEAQKWSREICGEYIKSLRGGEFTFRQSKWAIKRGFLPEQMKRFSINNENHDKVISYKDYAFVQPLNGIYSKWAMDVISVDKIFKPFRGVMPKCYYQISKRDAKTIIFPLLNKNSGDEVSDIIELLKKEGVLDIKKSFGEECTSLAYIDGKFYVGDKNINQQEMEKYLESFDDIMVITEHVLSNGEFTGSILRMVVFNEHGDDPVIGEAYIDFEEEKKCVAGPEIQKIIPCWRRIVDTVDAMCRFAPQLEFFGLDIMLLDDGFKIVRMKYQPDYMLFGTETSGYLQRKIEQKRASYTKDKIFSNSCQQIKSYILTILSRILFPKSFRTVKWLREQKKDFLTNKDTNLREKVWAFRHGFVSYRLHQYGITKENWKNYISDFEYRWLRHINNDYRLWMEDKITAKYICSDYKECFPEYYYHIILKNGKNKILPMMDCPEELGANYEDIFRLVQMKRYLALKPDEGSHGNGFYKFTYYDGKYYLNHKESTKQEVLDILQNDKNQYLITEYIDMHPEIKRIYAGAVNTIRMIVFKKDGKTPQIGNAYMRFGSKRTGAVDNMGAGGMYARIDVDTGRFYDAKIIEANEIKPCLYHPDTNEKIEGYLPNWEKIKQQILDVAKDIQQLEYFGFDLALTPDGLKFPEINRFPDYPAIEKYSPETIDYLLYRLDIKKRAYGYDKRKGCSIFRLPYRG